MNLLELEATALLTQAQTLLAPWVRASTPLEGVRLDVILDATDLVPAVHTLHAAQWGYLATLTGLDLGLAAQQLEALYHFCHGPVTLTLRVCVPSAAPVLPSLCAILPAASLFEREASEMLGFVFTEALDTRPLYLPDDWPVGVYPLRKDAALPEVAHGHA